MVHGSPYISWFIIHKNRKITRARPIQKSNSTSFWSKKFFHRMNYKNVTKRGAAEGHAQIFLGSEYSSSNWYENTKNSRQLLNTNMY